MANNRNLINAFDDCIERLATGESLDDILKDYPESADYLRDLLMIGERVSEVHNADDESMSAQLRGRDRLQTVLKEKPKRRASSRMLDRPIWYVATVAVASFVLMIGSGLFLTQSLNSQDPALDMTRASIAQANATTDSLIRETQAVMQNSFALTSTQLIGELTASAEPFMLVMTGTSIAQANATTESLIRQTQAQNAIYNDATINAVMPTLAPFEENFDVTATALFMLSPTFAPINPQTIITTSVASMAQSTVPPPGYLDTGDKLTNTGGGFGVNDAIKTTSMPNLSATSTMRPTVTGTPTPAPTQTLAPQGTPVADGSLIIPAQNNNNMPTPLPALIPLNAGEIDDNDEWDTYLLYRREFMARNIPFYDIDVTGRQIITVVDEAGQPVLGAKVYVYLEDTIVAENLTYADGRTMFLPNAYPNTAVSNRYTVAVTKDDKSALFTLDRRQSSEWFVTLSTVMRRDAVKLDVLFLMDTTSSMADEIYQLQNNILHISDAVDGFADNIDVHYGLVLYREHGNFEYVTRRHEFTSDVNIFQTYLNDVTANSGDNNPDWEEVLNVGLDESLRLMSWRDEDTIKLIFLVADAAPHINHPLEPITYDQSIQDALARGIKIHPIASSGLEPRGEFIFRQIAQVTMGHFLFLTYDNGATGTVGDVRPELDVGLPESLDPIGGYTVDRLADVVLRLIQDEILTYRGIIQP